ncbi:hypothetical protein MKX07_006629 [Trichoderma sp. CBMAI-0711]|nr:hypothetical protein MKX07_006629 [Trichoderma sp. CBMAI-0711]
MDVWTLVNRRVHLGSPSLEQPVSCKCRSRPPPERPLGSHCEWDLYWSQSRVLQPRGLLWHTLCNTSIGRSKAALPCAVQPVMEGLP